jgi:DMSO/TMAO reductase YedYZ molybdopterin-dependent catalytic subunit
MIWFGATLAAPLTLAGHWMERMSIDARDQSQAVRQDEWTDRPASGQRRDILTKAIGGALAFGIGGWAIGSLLRGTGAADVQIGAGQPLDSVRANLDGTPDTDDSAPASSTTPEPVNVIGDDFDAPAGVRPAITSNEEFYTVDISTRDPAIPEEQWTLKVTGLVDQELELTYSELLGMPSIEMPGTLMCISFTYGSELIGNTHWTGVRLRDVLQMASISDGAVELVLKGGGGYSDSIPIAKALDSQTLLAYGMNGETLPREHGFPCRLYVPNIYGEKNVKWLEEVQVVDFEYTGFWQERGWDAENENAVIHITCIIDTPLGEIASDESGTVPVGGVAFAGSRGIQSVLIQVDGGDWVETIVEPYEPELVWQRWKYDWPAGSGEHTLIVKAIDGEGNEQVAEENPPFPNGMTGLHEVNVQVL